MNTLTFEDFTPGHFGRYGPRHVTREEILAFAAEFDPQPMHLDEAAANASMLKGLSGSGWHLGSIMMRMLFDGARFGYLRKLLFRFRLSAGSGSGDNVVRVERSRDMWLTLRRKLEFTDEENRIIDGHLGDLEAAIFRAKGHRAIALHDWATAREMFREASLAADRFGLPLAHRLRMRLVRLLLAVRPQLAHHLFRRLRPDELEFVVD